MRRRVEGVVVSALIARCNPTTAEDLRTTTATTRSCCPTRSLVSTCRRFRWAATPPQDGQLVRVELAAGQIHRPVRVVDPERRGVPAIRATVGSTNGQTVRLRCGIEEYFVTEGAGRAIERPGEVRVVFPPSERGHGVIEHLILDGRRWRPSSCAATDQSGHPAGESVPMAAGVRPNFWMQ